MATGPFHGANLTTFKNLSTTVLTALTTAKYRAYARQNSYLIVEVRASSAAVAVAEITEQVKAIAGLDDLVDSGFTLTIEAVAPVVTWKTVYDAHKVKVVFTV